MTIDIVDDEMKEIDDDIDRWLDEMNKITSIIGRGTSTSKVLDNEETFGLVIQCFFEKNNSGLELRINEQYNQFLRKQGLLIRPSDLTTMRTNSKQERIDEIFNALVCGNEYLCKNIYPQLEKITEKYEYPDYLDYLKECAKGSYLIHIPEIQDYNVINQYSFSESFQPFFVVAVKDDELYGFGMDRCGYIRFGIFNKYHFCMMNLCSYDTQQYPMKVGDIVDEYDIFSVEELIDIFERMLKGRKIPKLK